MDIYIDESGDLGCGPKASEYFVIAGLIVRDRLPIHRCFKKIRRNQLKKSMKKIPEFKYNNTNADIKRRVFQCLATCDLDIVFAVIRKKQVDSYLREKNQTIYNDLAASLMDTILSDYPLSGPVNCYIDKSLYGIHRDNFNDYLIDKIMDRRTIRPDREMISIVHVDSAQEPCIQAADFVAGAVHKRYRENDVQHYRLIERKTTIELDYFEGRKK